MQTPTQNCVKKILMMIQIGDKMDNLSKKKYSKASFAATASLLKKNGIGEWSILDNQYDIRYFNISRIG